MNLSGARVVDGNMVVPLSSLGPRVRQVAEYYIENPHLTCKEVADNLGITRTRVSQIVNSNRFVNALRTQVQSNMRTMTPLASSEFRKCLIQSSSMDVKFRASVKLLEDQKILNSPTVNVHISPLAKMSNDELKTFVEGVKEIPSPTVETEIISDSSSENHNV